MYKSGRMGCVHDLATKGGKHTCQAEKNASAVSVLVLSSFLKCLSVVFLHHTLKKQGNKKCFLLPLHSL